MKNYIIEDFVASRKLAIVEDGSLEKIIIEEKNKKVKVKNIYRGKVEKVIPTMNACFVNIGEKNSGYLKVDKDQKIIEGENILVQVIKEEKGDKRSKLSTEIDFSGKYLVYIPSNTKVVFSNKIKDKDEKKRLQKELLEVSEGEKGFIIRTEAEGISSEQMKTDVEELRKKYRKVIDDYESSFYPKLLYSGEESVTSYIIENISEDVNKIIYTDGEFDGEIRTIIKERDRKYLDLLKREKNIDVFEAYGVNNMIKKYTSRNVWLKSGAYIVIDKTEAMTVIDVNTGSFKGKSGYEDTVFNVNMEAADEIVRQIIMRDISGIIIVDFIDMNVKNNKKELLEKLNKLFEKEGRRTKVHGYTKLGLVEISRMRKEQSIEQYFESDNKIVDDIERKVIFEKFHHGKSSICIEEKREILNMKKDMIEEIEKKYEVSIV